ncbi:MAG: hypothetical protein IPK23_14805 [Rhizobiales bacterium]|nr:hypothetical protein [Hyphomicrobiales bacterium]
MTGAAGAGEWTEGEAPLRGGSFRDAEPLYTRMLFDQAPRAASIPPGIPMKAQ